MRKRTTFKLLLVILGICVCNLAYTADLDILVIGSSHSYSEGNESGVVQEEAFSPSNIATQLSNILSDDPAITDNVNVVVEDIYKSKQVDTGMGSGGTLWDFTYKCYSLMQYYMWPDGKAARMSNLRGEGGTAWDYVIIMGDPYLMANMPGVYAEGVKLLVNEISSGTATPILLAQWPENSSTFTATQFNEIVYRVGKSAGIQVVPAGKAWDTMSGQDTNSNHPTPKGAYLAASAIYSKLYDKSAKTSDYNYNDSIADHALSVVQANASASQYTGTYSTINPFQMKYFRGRTVEWCEYGTSTEEGFANGLKAAFPIAGVNNTRRTGTSGNPVDFSYSRGTDCFEADKQYDYGTRLDNDNWTYGFPIGDHSNTGPTTMLYGIDKRFYGGSSFYNGTDLGIAYSMIRENQVPIDVRGTPVRLLWAKMNHADLGMNSHRDGWHLSNELDRAVGAYMYTMVSGRCPIEDEPGDDTSTEWKQWFCRKLGYETAWQMSHLTARVPGFRILPSATTALTVTPSTSETMSVTFIYSPQSPVTVSIAPNATSAAIVNPKTLTFDDTNYNTAQNVNVAGVPGASSAQTFNVEYTTTSDDEVYSGLSDSWEYTNNRASTESLTVTGQTDRQETAPKNGSKTIDLQVAGSSESNTSLAMPFHGTLSWSGPNVVYTPEADYIGSDSFAFAVNTAGTLTRGYIEITVEDVPEVKIVESGGSTDVVEGGATDTYDVFLSEAPLASVTVTISTDSQVNVSPTSLTFTTGNWSDSQTVTVTAVNDSDHELIHNGTVSHTTGSSDPNWEDISVNDVIATITDDDNQAPTVDAGANDTLVLSAAEPWTPADMTTAAWYDANDYSTITESSGAVSQWNDKSGNGNHATSSTLPTYNSSDSRLNNMPSIGYDTDAKKFFNLPSMTVRNVYIVTYFDDPDDKFDSWDVLISSADSTPRFGGHSGQNYFQDNEIDTAYKDGDTTTNYAGGVTVLPMSATQWTVRWDADETGTWKILGGNNGYNEWKYGAVGEVIFTDGTESLATTQKIEGYLAHKWGLEGNLPAGHPYKTDGPLAFGVTGNLDGTVGDNDGDSLTTTWSPAGGPVSAVLGDTAAVDTTATFTETGTYVFRLTVDDTYGPVYDEVTITVNDPASLPEVSVSATDASASEEGPDGGIWSVSRTGDTTDSLTVNFTLGGGATYNDDYTASATTSVTILSGNSSANVTLTPVDDSVEDEGVETATLTISTDAAYTIGTAAADISIGDNDTTYALTVVDGTDNTASGPYLPGTVVSITADAPPANNHFVNWTKSDGGTFGDANSSSTTYTMPTNPATVTANFEIDTYTVTFDKQGGTGGSDNVTATYGSAMPTASSPTFSGNIFGGYYTGTNGTGTQYYNADMSSACNCDLTADTTLFAKWTALATYTVTYNGNGKDGGTVPSDQTKYDGIDLTLDANSGNLSKTDFIFAGWNTQADGLGTDYAAGANYSIDADLDLYAKWEDSSLLVYEGFQYGVAGADRASSDLLHNQPDGTGGDIAATGLGGAWTDQTTVTASSDMFVQSGSLSFGDLETSGNHVRGDSNLNNDIFTNSVTADLDGGSELWFSILAKKLDTRSAAQGGFVIGNQVVNNSKVLLDTGSTGLQGFGVASPTGSNWTAYAWDGSTQTLGDANLSVATNDTRLLVGKIVFDAGAGGTDQFTLYEYQLNGGAIEGGILSPICSTIEVNVDQSTLDTLSLTRQVNTAYDEIRIGTSLSAVAPGPSATTYTVTYNGNGSDGGSVPADPSSPYASDTTVTVLGTGTMSRTGYTFSHWDTAQDGSGTDYNENDTFTISADTILYAQWTINQYTISFDSAGGTAVTDITQDFGTAVTAPAAPTKEGYTFTNWSPAVPATMPASNTTCVAQWTHDGTPHDADTNNDWSISQSEVESFISNYNGNNNTVTTTNGDITSGRITMRELMRVIYLYNDGGAYIGGQGTIDGYEVAAAAAPAPEAVNPDTGTGESDEGKLVVSSTADSGVGSLRDAIAIASNGETITIDDSVDTITLLSEIVIDKSITIDGNGVAIVSGEAQTRVFKVENTVEAIDVSIRNIGIVDAKNATDEFGGAVYNNGQTLTLDTVLFDGNANTSENGKGGAVYSSGELEVDNCVFTNNSASEENDVYSEN